jgi:hypothetical protein
MPGDFKGTVFQKNKWGVICLLSRNSFKNLIFWISLKQKLLHAYTEHTLYGKINTKSVYISVINNINFKKNLDSFYLHYMG